MRRYIFDFVQTFILLVTYFISSGPTKYLSRQKRFLKKYMLFGHSIMVKQFFSIGALKMSLEYYPEEQDISTEKALESFSDRTSEDVDISFRLDNNTPLPSLDVCRQIFTSNPRGLWTIFEDATASHYLISLQNVERERTPYRIIKVDREFREFLIYAGPGGRRSLFPLEYPLAELAVSGHLSINKIGIILHSACISWKGRGFLFSGVSGSGKSTISEIWRKEDEAKVLTDERVIIRDCNKDLWAYGTPWHGTAEIHINTGIPVENIFFIRHGKVNSVARISTMDAANRLITRCFPAFWQREGVEFALDYCARIARLKRCFDFQFVPDKSATDFLKKWDWEKQDN